MKALLALALLPSAYAGPSSPAAPQAQGQAAPRQDLTEEQFIQGLARLRKNLEERGEEPAVVEEFVGDIQRKTLAKEREGHPFPVARDAFEAFLQYEAAWARKTRDGKNAQVAPDRLAHEKERSDQLKKAFLDEGRADSPVLVEAYRSAVRRARAEAAAAKPDAAPSAASLFADQVDDSYTQVDAGDEALDAGDSAGALADANAAIAENPNNADAYVLKAGAELAQQDAPAALADAQQAVALDPGNPQADALVSLVGHQTDAGAGALAQATAVGDSLAAGVTAGSPQSAAAAVAAVSADPARPAAGSPTPSLGASLSSQLTAQAAQTAGLAPAAAAQQLGRALSLDPRNGEALNWTASIANRGGDYPSALSAANAALAVDPRDAHAWFAKGQALAGEKDLGGALGALREAARLDPTYVSDAEAASAAASGGTALSPLLFDPWLGAQSSGFTRRPRHKKFHWPAVPTGPVMGFGVLLLAFGIAQAFRSHR